MTLDSPNWIEATRAALESAREEVARRLVGAGLPLTLSRRRMVAVPNGPSEWLDIAVSGLHDYGAHVAIRDTSLDHRMFGLRRQLEPLAVLLNDHTVLGEQQRSGMFPGLTGVDGVLQRCVYPLALDYLFRLADLGVRDDQLLVELGLDVAHVASDPPVTRAHQIALEGVVPTVPMTCGAATIGPPRAADLGAYLEWQLSAPDMPRDLELAPFIPINVFGPTAVLEVVSTYQRGGDPTPASTIEPILLALLLSGFRLGSLGFVASFDRPRWMSTGYTQSPVPVRHTGGLLGRPLSNEDFTDVIALADAMPAFDVEASARSVALRRSFVGLGDGTEAGFLDLAIALEAALLGGASTELRYRFSLYGALFLRAELNPAMVFTKLQSIYDARSSLVHGTALQRPLAEVASDAADLARAVLRRSLLYEWPSASALNQTALGGVSPGTPSLS
ncbi:MAG TPA: hypothetical protein VFB78_08985 [Acidimicrobiales bacterium]|nr:hypothetical protein [Acidimicrobiales bacterium]